MREVRLLTAVSTLALLTQAAPALAQQQAPQDDAREADDSAEAAIVVTAPRGSVGGDILPDEVLDTRDILATGATSIAELLDALSPQIGSARGRGGRGAGGRPVILIEGKRVSGWRELRDLPTEAIERVDILPEEAALQFGFSADQRVVNFVLRERFNSTAVELEGELATRGGRQGGEIEVDRLLIRNGKRTTVSFETEAKSALTEDERDVELQAVEALPEPLDPRPYRTLLPATEDYQLNIGHSRPLGESSMNLSFGLDQSNSRSRFGLPLATFDVPGEPDEVVRYLGGDALARNRRSRNAELAAAVNGGSDWRWSSTGSVSWSGSRTRSDRGPDTDAFQLGLDALDPTFDPFGPLTLSDYPQDIARTESVRGEIDGLLSGQLGDTGAGPIGLSLRSQLTWSNFTSEGTSFGIPDPEVDLTRRRLLGRASLDVPLLTSDSAIGKLSVNANGRVESLSDFGELTSFGGGINWRPTRKLTFLASWEREEGSPSLTQLGDARVVEPLVRFFDFTTGETVFVDAVTGGNPDLLADTREVLKLSGNWRLPTKDDFRLTAEYVRERIDDPAVSFPAVSETLETAFPDRFVRDASGTLVSVDLTPVNYDFQKRDELRWGISWGKSIAAKPPSEETRAKMRERFQEMRAQRQREQQAQSQEGGPPAPPRQRPEGAPPAEGQQQAERQGPPQGGQARRGPPGGGGFFGRGRNGGRLGVNLYHTVNFTNEVQIAEGIPLIDYLDGDAVGRFGGTPRHEVELQAFRYNNGLGIRLGADWRSATTVDSTGGPIRFDDYADVNLRIWYSLSENPKLMLDNPWMRGMRIRVGIDNLFDNRPKVTAADGSVPFTYQPSLLEPEGRTISLSIRKMFVPRRFIREMVGGGRGRGPR